MKLWSIGILIEDTFKNLYSDYFEDFDGYLSSSLYSQEDNAQEIFSYLPSKHLSNKNNYLGEYHLNQFWVLEVIFDKKPIIEIIEIKLNLLSEQLNIKKYKTESNILNNTFDYNIIKLTKIINKNWLEENRKSFPIINIDKFCIYGTHISKKYPSYKVPIKINASIAFGTGSHATTKSCLKELMHLSKFYKPRKILDYGCGTGILGIAAKKIFKKSEIYFADIDKNAIMLAKENLKLNNIISNKIYQTNSLFYKEYIKFNSYDLVIANILYSPLYKLAPVFKKILKHKAKIILSGILKHQIPYIINRYKIFGFVVEKKISIDGWGAITMVQK